MTSLIATVIVPYFASITAFAALVVLIAAVAYWANRHRQSVDVVRWEQRMNDYSMLPGRWVARANGGDHNQLHFLTVLLAPLPPVTAAGPFAAECPQMTVFIAASSRQFLTRVVAVVRFIAAHRQLCEQQSHCLQRTNEPDDVVRMPCASPLRNAAGATRRS